MNNGMAKGRTLKQLQQLKAFNIFQFSTNSNSDKLSKIHFMIACSIIIASLKS